MTYLIISNKGSVKLMIKIIPKEIAGVPVLEVVKAELADQAIPVVVFFHGWTGNKEKVISNGFELARQNIRAVLPDALFHGERIDGPIESHQFEFWQIVLNSIKEFPALIKYYQDTVGIPAGKIGAAGTSMGGITTDGLLATNQTVQAAVSLMGTPQPVTFAKYLLSELPEAQAIAPDYFAEEFKELAEIDLSLHPERLANRPVHFWHGDKDTLVPYALDYDFYQTAKNQPYGQNLTFTTTKGVGHSVPYPIVVEMAEKFKEYFQTTLNEKA